jgi:small-conductance mechanosensitive channel
MAIQLINFAPESMNQIHRLSQALNNLPLSNFVIFLILVALSILIGQHTAKSIQVILVFLPRQQRQEIYQNLIKPIKTKINFIGTWILLYWSWYWLEQQENVPSWFDFFIDLALTIFAVWFLSRLFHQLTKVYGVTLLREVGGEVTEILLAVETIFNLIVVLIAFTAFAYTQKLPLTGFLAGASISGIALSFAAQNTLQQLFGTVILFLDKPFIQGEYIRLPNGTFGRVESIGLRSTKIRTAGKNTLLIVPNSKMADWEIENVTRGKKVMILLYFDFERLLDNYEKSLVRQIVTKYINSFFGVEPDTYNLTFLPHPNQKVSRVRITFFILGSTESSLELRRRVIEISETQLSQELRTHGIIYTANEPVITVDSPITL